MAADSDCQQISEWTPEQSQLLAWDGTEKRTNFNKTRQNHSLSTGADMSRINRSTFE